MMERSLARSRRRGATALGDGGFGFSLDFALIGRCLPPLAMGVGVPVSFRGNLVTLFALRPLFPPPPMLVKMFFWSAVVGTALGLTQLMLVTGYNREIGISDQFFSLGDTMVLTVLGLRPPPSSLAAVSRLWLKLSPKPRPVSSLAKLARLSPSVFPTSGTLFSLAAVSLASGLPESTKGGAFR